MTPKNFKKAYNKENERNGENEKPWNIRLHKRS